VSSPRSQSGARSAAFYPWCGERICQARAAANVTTCSYYEEGEPVPGAPVQPLYYGIDQIGSARRLFASVAIISVLSGECRLTSFAKRSRIDACSDNLAALLHVILITLLHISCSDEKAKS
jgi:hypothetical protein